MSKTLLTIFSCGVAGILSYGLMVAVTPNTEQQRKKFMAEHADILNTPVRAPKMSPKISEEEQRAQDFKRVLLKTAAAEKTVYGAKDAKAQGIHATD